MAPRPTPFDLALVAVTVVGMLSLVLLLVWAGIRMSLAPAAVVLERVGPWRGIRRASQPIASLIPDSSAGRARDC